MEDISKDTVVNQIILVVVGFYDSRHIPVEELKRTTHIFVDSCRSEKHSVLILFRFDDLVVDVKSGEEGINHLCALLDSYMLTCLCLLSCLKGALFYLMRTLNHQLEHETTHLSRLPICRSIIVDEGDIAGSL